jgi:hypothetical protein
MNEWFSKAKNCPGRERLLAGVPGLYKELIASGAEGTQDKSIENAESSSLEAVAKMIAFCVDREQSLVDWIEKNHQTFPPEPDKWYAICCAAGWIIIQTYFRERVSQSGGGKA